MNTYLKPVFSLVACCLLTGCNGFQNWKHDQTFKAWKNGKDFCGKHHIEKFIGTAIDDITIQEHLPEDAYFRVQDRRIDQVITTELRYNRGNIHVGKNGIIEKVTCG